MKLRVKCGSSEIEYSDEKNDYCYLVSNTQADTAIKQIKTMCECVARMERGQLETYQGEQQ